MKNYGRVIIIAVIFLSATVTGNVGEGEISLTDDIQFHSFQSNATTPVNVSLDLTNRAPSVAQCHLQMESATVHAIWTPSERSLKTDWGSSCLYPIVYSLNDPSSTPITIQWTIEDDYGMGSVDSQGFWEAELSAYSYDDSGQLSIVPNNRHSIEHIDHPGTDDSVTIEWNPILSLPSLHHNQTDLGLWTFIHIEFLGGNMSSNLPDRHGIKFWTLHAPPFDAIDTVMNGTQPQQIQYPQLPWRDYGEFQVTVSGQSQTQCNPMLVTTNQLSSNFTGGAFKGKSNSTTGFLNYGSKISVNVTVDESSLKTCFRGTSHSNRNVSILLTLDVYAWNGTNFTYSGSQEIERMCAPSLPGFTWNHSTLPPHGSCQFNNLLFHLGGGAEPMVNQSVQTTSTGTPLYQLILKSQVTGWEYYSQTGLSANYVHSNGTTPLPYYIVV